MPALRFKGYQSRFGMALLCASKVSLKVCRPPPLATKNRYLVAAGVKAAANDSGPGFEIGPGGSPAAMYVPYRFFGSCRMADVGFPR